MPFNKLPILYIAVIALICQQCTPLCNDCEAVSTGQAFFPTEIGRYVDYDVSEQEFGLGRAPVSRTYQIREQLTERYTDLSGQEAIRIVRFRRNSDAQRWQPDSTIVLRVGIDRATRNENGLNFVKMVFPVAERSTWDGNVYNNLGEDRYELRNLNRPLTIGNRTFERTATVIQQNDSTLVNLDKRIEIYAENVGLIQRETVVLQFCSSTPACVGRGQVDFGIRRIFRFRSEGKE